jgi:hypothetical protein
LTNYFPKKIKCFPYISEAALRVPSQRTEGQLREENKVLLLLIVLLLLFGGGGGYYGYSRWGAGGGLGIVGTVVVIAILLYFLGVIH